MSRRPLLFRRTQTDCVINVCRAGLIAARECGDTPRDSNYAVATTHAVFATCRVELLACIDRKLGNLFDTLYLGPIRKTPVTAP